MPAEPAVELCPREQRECREYAVLHRKDPLSLARLAFGAEPSGHRVEQGEACPRKNRERDQHLEQCHAAVSARTHRYLP